MALGSPRNALARPRYVDDTGRGTYPAGPRVRVPRALPSPEALDYVSKFTSTSFLLIGAAVFLLVFARSPRRAIARVAERTAGVKP